MVSDGLLSSLKVEVLPNYKSYLEGKMTKIHVPSKGNRASNKLELIHFDLGDPMNLQAEGGSK